MSYKKKTLIPSKLGLVRDYSIPYDNFIVDTLLGIDNEGKANSIPSKILQTVSSTFLTASGMFCDGGGELFLSTSPKKLGLSNTEFKYMISDIAESVCAAYVMKQGDNVQFYQPNNMLVDFKINDQEYSVKCGSGGKISMKALPYVVSNGIVQNELFVINAIFSIEKNIYDIPFIGVFYLNPNILDILLECIKKLLPTLRIMLPRNYRTIITKDFLVDAISIIKDYDHLIEVFDGYFDACGFYPDKDVATRLLTNPRPGKDRPWGLLHFPLTSYVVRTLNESKIARDILAKSMNKSSVKQIYLDTKFDENSTTLKFKIKNFSGADFHFGTPASCARPTKNRISFIMNKKDKE